MIGDWSDDADRSQSSGNPENLRRSCRSGIGHRIQRIGLADLLKNLFSRDKGRRPIGRDACRHVLDEPDLVGGPERKRGKIQEFAVVYAPNHHRVDLHGRKTGFLGGVDSVHCFSQIAAAREHREGLRLHGIETHIEAVHPGAPQIGREFSQHQAVRCDDEFLQPIDSGEVLEKIDKALPDQWFAARNPDLFDAQGSRKTRNAVQFLKTQNIAVPEFADSLGGHAVLTAQIAPVGDRKPEVVDATTMSVDGDHMPDTKVLAKHMHF